MLHLLYGGDTVAARKKMHAVLNRALEKDPAMPIDFFDAETLVPAELGALVGEQGLFSSSRALLFDDVLAAPEALGRALPLLAEMAASPNLFIFLEREPEAETVRAFQKAGAEVGHSPVPAAGAKFNVFPLTDALGRRDRKNLWLEFRQALSREGGDERILIHVNSMLFWQVKTMLLAAGAGSAEEAGMKPYPYQKARSFLKNYTPDELHRLSAALVSLPHEAHRGIVDLEIGLERFILSI